MNGYSPGNSWLDNVGGYSPMITGTPFQQNYGMQGVPFMNMGGLPGAAMNFIGAPMAQAYMQQHGMMPFGFGSQNMADYLRTRSQMGQLQQTTSAMMQYERDNYMRMFNGARMIAGGAPNPAADLPMATALANNVNPFLAVAAPEFLDALNGQRGSAMVMASRMLEAGRYRMDPVTGLMGQEAATSSAIAGGIYQSYFGGNNFSLQNTRGLTAGQFGSMYGELAKRGLIESSGMSRAEETRWALQSMQSGKAADPTGFTSAFAAAGLKLSGMDIDVNKLSGSELEKLRMTSSVSDRMKTLDTNNVKKALDGYKEAVAAMRDIFGDAGNPNAPMTEIFKGLEALSRGAAHQIGGRGLANLAQNMRAVSQVTGVSMDTMMTMEQHAASKIAALGGDPTLALGMSTAGAQWISAAAGISATPSWGRKSQAQFAQADMNLRAGAASSSWANKLSLVMAMREEQGGHFKNKQLENMANAIVAGDAGSIDTSLLRTDRLTAMLTGEVKGLTGADVRARLLDKQGLAEYGHKYSIGNTVRELQPGSVQNWLASRSTSLLKQQILSRAKAAGRSMSDNEAEAIARNASGSLAAGIMGMSDAQMSDTDTRNKTYGRLLREAVGSAGGEGLFDSAADQAAGAQFGSGLDRASSFKYHDRFQNVQATMNRQRLSQAGEIGAQAYAQAVTNRAFGVFGGGSLLSRLVDSVGRGKSAADVILTGFGAIENEKVQAGMTEALSDIASAQGEMNKARAELAAEKDPQKQREIKERMNGISRTMAGHAERFGRGLKEAGISYDKGTGRTYSTAQMDAVRKMGVAGLAVLRKDLDEASKAGSEVSDADYARLTGDLAALKDLNGLPVGDKATAAFGSLYKRLSSMSDKDLEGYGLTHKDVEGIGKRLGITGKGAGGKDEMKISGTLTVAGDKKFDLSAFGIG